MRRYDTRLDSRDAIIRQQAEIEALRTALTAANSESNGEYERLRTKLKNMTASYEGQKRNTLAFYFECEKLRAELAKQWEPAMPNLSKDELNLIRQWFNAVEDCAPDYLDKADYDLMEKIMSELPGFAFKRRK